MAGITGVDAARPDLPMPSLSKSPEVKDHGNDKVRQAAKGTERGLSGSVRLRVFQPTGRVYVEVVNPATQEVVKTVPPMEMLKVQAALRQTLGLLVDQAG